MLNGLKYFNNSISVFTLSILGYLSIGYTLIYKYSNITPKYYPLGCSVLFILLMLTIIIFYPIYKREINKLKTIPEIKDRNPAFIISFYTGIILYIISILYYGLVPVLYIIGIRSGVLYFG